MRKIKDNKKRPGSAMVFVIIIMAVFSILAMSMSMVFSSNLKQAKYQQDSLEAYYLAYSGALIIYEALLANSYTKLDELRNGGTLSPQVMTFDNGSTSATAIISTDANFVDYIKIVSTATLSRNNFKYTRTMYFDPDNPLDILWKSN